MKGFSIMKKVKLLSLLMSVILIYTSITACRQEPAVIPETPDKGNEDIIPDSPNNNEQEPPTEPPIAEPPVVEPPIEPEPIPPEDPVAPTEPIAPTEPEYPYYYPQKDPNDTPVDKEDQVEVEIPLITVTKPENYVYPSDTTKAFFINLYPTNRYPGYTQKVTRPCNSFCVEHNADLTKDNGSYQRPAAAS